MIQVSKFQCKKATKPVERGSFLKLAIQSNRQVINDLVKQVWTEEEKMTKVTMEQWLD